jgi:hypothetical protein
MVVSHRDPDWKYCILGYEKITYIETVSFLIQSHFMWLHFAGWRTIELDQYETSGLFEHCSHVPSFQTICKGSIWTPW